MSSASFGAAPSPRGTPSAPRGAARPRCSRGRAWRSIMKLISARSSRAPIPVKRRKPPRDLPRPVEVEQPERRRDLPVGPRLEGEPLRLAPERTTRLSSASPRSVDSCGMFGIHAEPDQLVHRRQLVVEGLDLLADPFIAAMAVGVLAAPLLLPDHLGGLVATVLRRLGLDEELPAPLVQLEVAREVDRRFLEPDRLLDLRPLRADPLRVEHRYSSLSAVARACRPPSARSFFARRSPIPPRPSDRRSPSP